MRNKPWLLTKLLVPTLLILLTSMPASVMGEWALGPRAGVNLDTDQFVIGGEAEFGRVLQSFRFAPSVDIELGDNGFTAINSDFRLYLFNLPETGLRFYGSVGPTLLLDSRDGSDTETEIGLSLVAGIRIPMAKQNRYHIETRFGFGDIPDFKLMFSLLLEI